MFHCVTPCVFAGVVLNFANAPVIMKLALQEARFERNGTHSLAAGPTGRRRIAFFRGGLSARRLLVVPPGTHPNPRCLWAQGGEWRVARLCHRHNEGEGRVLGLSSRL